MKKKRLPLWAVLALAALYLIFGIGGEEGEATLPTEQASIVTEALQSPTETGEVPPDLTEFPETQPDETEPPETEPLLPEEGSFTSREDVALYIHLYGHLPENFITKQEARDLGWEGGGLEDFAPGKCIGGDRFGNYEGLLPDVPGRKWTECDIDTLGKNSRGAKRIVFSNDGLVYYTDDHYESFTLLYGEP